MVRGVSCVVGAPPSGHGVRLAGDLVVRDIGGKAPLITPPDGGARR